ncbi:MAG: DUF4407 domain-containing protein [Bacteroidota bacterium]
MIKSFFWMCSGADPELLSESPQSEQIKYAGIGGTVFFTALMAFIASSYALFTVFDSIPIAIGFGLVWGLLIFNLDRFIVSSIKRRDNKWDELLQAVPRIVLAVIIAVVISKPLELKIFEKEIDRVLLEQKNEMTLQNQEQVGLIYAEEISTLQNSLDKIDERIDQKDQEVNALYDTFIAEAEGREGTMKLGKGPVYAEKRAKHDEALTELRALKEAGEEQKVLLLERMRELEQSEKEHIAQTQPVIDRFDGLMARIGALGELPWLPSFFIFLLFLAIETSPIIAKLMSNDGEYDIKLYERQNEVLIWAEQKGQQRKELLLADKELNKRVYTSLKDEDESYHYKKQKARALIFHQADAFLEKQKRLTDLG